MRLRVDYLALALLIIALSLSQSSFAETNPIDNEHFDGSEFKPSTFTDASLDKEQYKELSSSRHRKEQADENVQSALKKRINDTDISAASGEDKVSLEYASAQRTEVDNTQPVHDLPSDWVPDKLDLTSNGGFSIAPFNGSPVPYDLNGHVDLEQNGP